jgi:hypothetical protein
VVPSSANQFMTFRGMGSKARRLLIAFVVLSLAIVAVASPALSSTGGVGDRNLQASDCSAHSVTSSATISMSSSKLNPSPGEQITVTVTVSGGPTSGLMGVALLSKTSGTTGTTPSQNGWTIVQDPSGTTYNYVEQSYTGSKTFTWTLKAPSSGTPVLYAKIFHGSAAYVKLFSTGLTFTIASTAPPTVQITSPSSNAVISGTINVAATVTPGTGATISSVDLNVDGALVATDTTSPYSWSLNTLSYTNAVHTLQVTATDNGGRKGSAQITVTVSNIANPTVDITSPVNGATVGGTIIVSVTATASSGASISSVQMKVDSVLVGSDTSSPYSFNLDTVPLPKGTHIVDVTALDNGGRQGTDQISITVNNDPPAVSFTSPAPGATLAGTATVSASAVAYAGRSISSVELRVDGASSGIKSVAPYTWNLDTSVMLSGLHTLNLTCVDSSNLRGYAQIVVNIDSSAPTISIIQPSNGAMIAGQMSVEAQVSSSSSITKVSLLVDGSLIGELATAPFLWTVDSGAYPDGQHIVLVTAMDAYSRSSSLQISVTFNNLGEATAVPVVTIGPPTSGATLLGTVSVQASVTSVQSLSWVRMYLDEVQIGNDTSPPYQWTLQTYSYPDGPHIINVTACDILGVRGYQVLNVNFNNPAPLVLVDLADGALVFGKLDLNVTTNSSAPVSSISAYIDDSYNWSITTPAGVWKIDTNLLSSGSHKISICATALNGKVGYANITMIVDNSPPVIELLNPAPGEGVYGTVDISVTIRSNFTIGSVNLTIGGLGFGDVQSPPYQWSVNTSLIPEGQGLMVISASASNNLTGLLEVSIMVQNGPPSLALTRPDGVGPFTGNLTLEFEVLSMIGVEYLSLSLDDKEFSNLTGAPYSVDLETYKYSNGQHLLKTLARAPNGALAEASWNLSIANPLPSIELQSPLEGEVIGTFDVLVNVSAPYDINYLIIELDGGPVANLTSAPYALSLDSSSYANGEHVLNVTAIGKGGQASSKSMVLSIANPSPQQRLELGSVDLMIIQGLAILIIVGIVVKIGGRKKR